MFLGSISSGLVLGYKFVIHEAALTVTPRADTVVALPAARGQDAMELVEQLAAERCTLTLGQVTDDPHGLTRQLFEPEIDAKFNEYAFANELWVGTWGTRVTERYLIFHPEAQGYRLVDCIPFRPMGNMAILVDGRDAESMTFGLYDRTPRGYDKLTATYILDAGRRTLVSAELIDPFLYRNDITTWDESVDDPWYWAQVQFGLKLNAMRDSLWGFEVDLDHDGVSELGITTQISHGSGGGGYAFFRRDGDNYRFIGYLELRTLQVLPLRPDGTMHLRTFFTSNAACHSAATFTNDGAQFQRIEVSRVCTELEADAYADGGDIIIPERIRFDPDGNWAPLP